MDVVFQRKPQKLGEGAESYWQPATPTGQASTRVSNHHATRYGGDENGTDPKVDFRRDPSPQGLSMLRPLPLKISDKELHLLKYGIGETRSNLETDLHVESYGGKFNMLEQCPLNDPDQEIRLLRFSQTDSECQGEICMELSAWAEPKWIQTKTYVVGTQEESFTTPRPRKPSVPKYAAASYTWGSDETSYPIYVNGCPFAVRRNCLYALMQAQAHCRDEYIWIDSICINQDDAEEKSVQVQKMGEIFAHAEHVLICVGPHGSGSESLLDYGRQLKEFRRHILTTHDQEDLDELPEDFREVWRTSRDREDVEEYSEAITAFADRPYWSRLWVVQEIANAKSKQILCGDHVLEFEHTAYFEALLPPEGYDYFRTVTIEASPRSLSLHEAVMRFKTFHCSDVRDRLFGILGLINWKTERPGITIANYSLSPFEVLLLVINCSKFLESRVIDAMNMFGQTSTTQEMRQLIARAREDRAASKISETNVEEPYDVRKLRVSPSSLCQLEEDHDGRLRATFVRNMSQNNPIHLDSKFSMESWDMQNTTPIYSAGSIAALACADARKGDILVSGSNYRQENLIVLRRKAGQDYDIIGQALSVDGFRIASDARLCEKRAVLKLTAPEAVLLFGQDYLGMDGKGRAVIDSEAQLERLRTAVVLSNNSSTRAFLRDSALQEYGYYE